MRFPEALRVKWALRLVLFSNTNGVSIPVLLSNHKLSLISLTIVVAVLLRNENVRLPHAIYVSTWLR